MLNNARTFLLEKIDMRISLTRECIAEKELFIEKLKGEKNFILQQMRS